MIKGLEALPVEILGQVCSHLEAEDLAKLEAVSARVREMVLDSGWQRGHYQHCLGLTHRPADLDLLLLSPGRAWKGLLRERHLLKKTVSAMGSWPVVSGPLALKGPVESYLATMPALRPFVHERRQAYRRRAIELDLVGQPRAALATRELLKRQEKLDAAVQSCSIEEVARCLKDGAQVESQHLQRAITTEACEIFVKLIEALPALSVATWLQVVPRTLLKQIFHAPQAGAHRKLAAISALLRAGYPHADISWLAFALSDAPLQQLPGLLSGMTQLRIMPPEAVPLPIHVLIDRAMQKNTSAHIAPYHLVQVLTILARVCPAQAKVSCYGTALDYLLQCLKADSGYAAAPFCQPRDAWGMRVKVLVDGLLAAGCPVNLTQARVAHLHRTDVAWLARGAGTAIRAA